MKRFLLSVLIFILLAAGCVVAGYYWFESENHVAEGDVSISKGASAKQIAEILEASELIGDANVFYYYLRAKELYFQYVVKDPTAFQIVFKNGEYHIDKGNFDTLVSQLNSGEIKNDASAGVKVTIPEGYTVAQIAELIESKGISSKEDILHYTTKPEYYEFWKNKYMWLPEYDSRKVNPMEGYLHANTYNFHLSDDPSKIMKVLLAATNDIYTKKLRDITKRNMSFDEIITLASVVERESKFPEDRPKVAQVFLNRLENGMKLESDITAIYALGEHKTMLSYKDIAVDSPYNTYVKFGLPLGPICSPSMESINSVLQPIGSDFKALYFYARPSGETYYANTYEEHELNRLQFESEWLDLEN